MIGPSLNLPFELTEYLSTAEDLTLDSEGSDAGVATLHPMADLQLGVVNVDSDESPLREDDPNAGMKGSYRFVAAEI